MALTIRKIDMPTAKYPVKCPYIMNPTRIVIHNTANDAPAENEIRSMQSNNAQTSFHFAVDEKEAVQGVEMWRNAWHAGDGQGKGNREGIAIEICFSKSGGTRFEEAEKNAAELTARLLLDFGWGIDKVTKHQDYSGKYCPHRTLNLGWDRFLAMVEKKRRILAGLEVEETDDTTLNGYRIVRAKDFTINYFDAPKKSAKFLNYINGGFFGPYAESGINFTLPVGNLVCDVLPQSLSLAAAKYVSKHLAGTKLIWSVKDNASMQFQGKAVSTLVLPHTGTPYVSEVTAAPASARYAISGIPVIRKGEDVSYRNFVLPQGWDESPFYATMRNFIGLKGSAIYIVSGTSKSANFVATSEVYDALRPFGFDDLIALDGGGSAIFNCQGKQYATWENRQINNIIRF